MMPIHFLLDVDGGRVAHNMGPLASVYHTLIVTLVAIFLALSRWLMDVTQLVVTMRMFSTDSSTSTSENSTTTTTTTAAAATTTTPPAIAGDESPEVIIIGAGIAGCALAAVLGQDNRRVMVIERDLSEPDRIVGELLQPGGVAQLEQLGLGECVEGIDSPLIKGYSIFWKNEKVCLTYPAMNQQQHAAATSSIVTSTTNHTIDDSSSSSSTSTLSTTSISNPSLSSNSNTTTALIGRSFHHGRFIMNLRRAASKQRTVSLVEGTVTDLVFDSSSTDTVCGVSYKRKDSGETVEVRAPLTVICDGLFSRFRKQIVSENLHSKSSFVGLVLKDLDLPFPNHGHVILADPSPVLLYPISSTETRILVDVPQPTPTNLREYLLSVTAPQLPGNGIRESFESALKSGAQIRSMPAGRLHPEPVNKRGVLMIGDAFNVRNPLTGGGMTVAFTDCNILRSILQQVPDLSDKNRVAQMVATQFYTERRKSVAIINVLAQALYEVFSATLDPIMVEMQEACFRYFLLGERFTTGPMSMLSCVCSSKASLIYHFFSVGFYAMGRVLLPIPTPTRIYNSIRLGYLSAKILLPLLWNEHVFSLLYPKFQPSPSSQEQLVSSKLD